MCPPLLSFGCWVALQGAGNLHGIEQKLRWCGALYLVPQTLYKLHPDFDKIVARILSADSSGCAVFIQASDPWVTQGVSNRLSQALQDAGLVGPARVFFVPRYVVIYVAVLFVALLIIATEIMTSKAIHVQQSRERLITTSNLERSAPAPFSSHRMHYTVMREIEGDGLAAPTFCSAPCSFWQN